MAFPVKNKPCIDKSLFPYYNFNVNINENHFQNITEERRTALSDAERGVGYDAF